MKSINLPEILNIPKKLLPFIYDFNKYSYFLLEGGTASGKTQSVARFLLYIMEVRHVRICCGREIQNSINESVRTVFLDLIEKDENEYVVLLPVEPLEGEEEGSVVILKVESSEDDENESYVSIENEEEAEEIFNIFKDRFKDELDFAD